MNLDNHTAPAYGKSVYRCLHSELLTWIVTAPDGHGHRVAAHFGWQLDFARFTLAIHYKGWARVVTRVSEDGADAWVGLELPVEFDGRGVEWQRLFELHHTEVGLTPGVVIALATDNMNRALADVIEARL